VTLVTFYCDLRHRRSGLFRCNRRVLPCRHILLTPRGETVNSFCQWGTKQELETVLRAWLERSTREVEA